MADEIRADYASGQTLYAVIRDPQGQVWYPTGQAFEAWGSSGRNAGDYAIPLTDKSGSRYVGDFDDNVSSGRYYVQVFLQAGANPADTDGLVSGRELVWSGVGELTTIKLLANKSVQKKDTLAVTYYDDDGETVLFTHDTLDGAATFTRLPT